jgi:hypothetical protein
MSPVHTLPFPLLHGMEEREFAGSWWKIMVEVMRYALEVLERRKRFDFLVSPEYWIWP